MGNSSEVGAGGETRGRKNSRPQAGAPRIQSRDCFWMGNSFCRQPSGLLRVSCGRKEIRRGGEVQLAVGGDSAQVQTGSTAWS